jgi:hypothetical protein
MPVPLGTDASGDSCYPSTNIDVSSLSLMANHLADYAVLAPGLTRSRFFDVRFGSGRRAGLSIAYGWHLAAGAEVIYKCRTADLNTNALKNSYNRMYP